MTEFKGFPSKMLFTPVPNLVFSTLLPELTDIIELKVLLNIFEIVYLKKGLARFVTRNELWNQAGLRNSRDFTEDSLAQALKNLVEKKVVLYLSIKKEDKTEDLYFLNSEPNTRLVVKIQNGEIELPGTNYVKIVQTGPVETPDIFTLYEQNIGILTPIISDELKEACKQYPEDWIKEAIKQAVTLNKRNWKYIARILEHWLSEGKDDGTYRGNPKQNEDPDKYFRGKYGHMVRH